MRPFPDHQLITNIQTNIYISMKFNDMIQQTSLRRAKYLINNNHSIDQFDALYYNEWNLYSLNHYMNLLIGGTRKKIITLIDGNTINNWRQLIENDDGIKCIYGTVTNEGLENLPDC
jgi:hypothetical protein